MYRRKKINIWLSGSVSQGSQCLCFRKLNKVTLKVATSTIMTSKVIIQHLFKIPCSPVPRIHYIPIANEEHFLIKSLVN